MKLNLIVVRKEDRALYDIARNYHGDAGYDLYCTEDMCFLPGKTGKVKTGVTGIPEDKLQSYMLFPRSSIYKTPLRLANSIGLIDSGYRGEIIAVFDNRGTEEYTVKRGDRLVQLVAFNGRPLDIELYFENPNNSAHGLRGNSGFGSTGL